MISTGRKFYRILLEPDEREHLKEILDSGKGSKERRRVHILLLADQSRSDGGLSDEAISGDFGTPLLSKLQTHKV